MSARVGDEVLCVGCQEWVPIRQGINALIPAKGHCFHFYTTPKYVKQTGVAKGGPPMATRSHHIGPLDRTRKAQQAAA